MKDKIVEQDLTCPKCKDGKVHLIQSIPEKPIDYAFKVAIKPCTNCKYQFSDLEELTYYKNH